MDAQRSLWVPKAAKSKPPKYLLGSVSVQLVFGSVPVQFNTLLYTAPFMANLR